METLFLIFYFSIPVDIIVSGSGVQHSGVNPFHLPPNKPSAS